MTQRNTKILPGEDPRKFQIGARLRFLGISEGELGCSFRPGDTLVVMEQNGCGMGIDAHRDGDPEFSDMVWADEVEVVCDPS